MLSCNKGGALSLSNCHFSKSCFCVISLDEKLSCFEQKFDPYLRVNEVMERYLLKIDRGKEGPPTHFCIQGNRVQKSGASHTSETYLWVISLNTKLLCIEEKPTAFLRA